MSNLQRLKLLLLLVLILPFVRGDAQRDPLDNLIAFIRLVGDVRYFYPGDVAAETDWDAFTLHYVEASMSAENPAVLARELNAWFAPYAPGVHVFVTGAEPPTTIDQPAGATGVTLWGHVPLGAGRTAQLVEGSRMRAPLGAAEVDYVEPVFGDEPITTIPVRLEPYVVDLGGGVSAVIPLTVYSDDIGTLPHSAPPAPLEQGVTSATALQFAILAKAWNAIQHFFPYWREIDWQWDAALRTALTEVLQPTAEPFLYTVQRMMARIGDGHSFTSGGGTADGGAYMLPFTWDVIEGQLVVTTRLSDDSPLPPGTVITAIDGVPAADVLAARLERESPVGQWGSYNALRLLGSGAPNETLTLTTASGDVVVPFSVRANSSLRTNWREERPATIIELEDGIWYIDVMRLTAGELSRAIPSLADARGLVLDARGYPTDFTAVPTLLGHLTDEPLSTAPFYVPIVTMPDHHEWQWLDVRYDLVQPLEARLTSNIAWILNGNGAVSAAETIMGIVEGYHLGEIVGEPSAGANGNRVSFSLPGGYATSWTGLYVTKFDGSPLFGVGVTPTIPFNRTIAGVAAGRDELFEQALDVVRAGLD